MKMLSVRLDNTEFAALCRLCEQLGGSRSQVVKRGIAELAKRHAEKRTPHELARQLEIIGSFKGHPNLSEEVSARVNRKLRTEYTARQKSAP